MANIWGINTYCWVDPFVTRVGDTLVVDSEDRLNVDKWLLKKLQNINKYIMPIGGHNDGSFCPKTVGHIITAMWHTDYSETFDWDVHVVRDEGSKDKLYDRDMKKFQIFAGSKKENR